MTGMDEEQIEEAGEDGGGEENAEPKIGLVLGVLGTIIAIAMDILSLIPFAGDIEEVPAGAALILGIFGGVANTALVTQGLVMLAKAIPAVQELPLWTPAWLFTWYIEAHPSKLTKVVEVAATAAGGGAGAAGAAGELEGAASAGAAAAETGSAVGAAGTVAGTAAEEGAAAEGVGTEAASVEKRPSRTRPSGETGEATEERPEKSPEEERREERLAEAENEMRSGEEVPWNERLEEEMFNPEETRFREAGPIDAKRTDEDDGEEEEEEEKAA